MSIKEQNRLIKEIKRGLIHTANMNSLKAFHIACETVKAIIKNNNRKVVR